MLEILQYPFFQKAIAGVLIISIAAAVIGTYIVTRRLVAISGGITHACFGGLGLGYYLGINPVITAAAFAVFASLGVDWMASRARMREDSAIAVVWALGMAIGVFFVFLTPGYVPELNSFLFGNVLTITTADLLAFALFTIVLAAFVAWKFKEIVACAFDRDFAAVMHMPVRSVTTAMTVLTAVCIVLTIRLVGVMLLMSMLAMPQIISEVFCRRFSSMMWCSIAVSAICCLTGLLLTAVIDVPCSALIVMVMVTVYVAARIVKALAPRRKGAVALIGFIAASVTLAGCNLKKNTAASRQYTAFITRYNIYFNGNEHYNETLQKMEREYADDYSRTLFLHPAEAYADEKAPQPSGDFKRSIEKAQKAIQIRSIKKRPARKPGKSSDPEYKKWLKRDEYNPFLHNAWMMMARSQYMNGDFLGAAATFYYITRHFTWLPATVTEAKLWQARCYCACDWLFEAESILRSIKEKDIKDNSTLEGLYYFSYADLYVKQHDYGKAIPMLQQAIRYAKGAQKTRLTFLLGQLYADTGQRAEAYATFKKVGGMSGAGHRTQFNARIKQSEVFQGTDISSEVKALQRLARFGSNREYLDQIYYAIGNLYLSHADTAQAIANYEKAIKSSTRDGIDKAIAQITLGRLYYGMGEYDKAQPCYAEALPKLPDTYPDYRLLKRRSDVLDEMAVYSQNVTLQDSLLRLSHMTPEEQRKVIDKIIADLNQREKEEAENARREEYLAQQAAAGNGLQLNGSGSSAPATFQLNTDKSWYFYNEATRSAGRTEFQKRWGSRRLEDDWRRRNKASFSLSDEDGTDDNEDNDGEAGGSADNETEADGSAAREAAEHASDPHYPEYYLRQIPSTEAERLTANDIIQDGLYNMAVLLKDKLDDIPAAEREFNELLTRYPDNIYRLDAYYNMYLMYARAGNETQADRYRRLIISEFPDSRQGEALADPGYIEKLRRMPEEEQKLYDRAYAAYMANDNATLHRIYDEMRRDYPMSRIMPKFMFIEALSYVTENNPAKFAEVLGQLVGSYPDTDVSPLASSYLQLLGEGRTFNSSGGNVRGIVWSTRLSNDSTANATLDTPAEFDFETDGPHDIIFIYRTDLVNANRLLFEVARHNFSTYSVRDFDLEQMQFGTLGLLVVSGFDSQAEALRYREKLESGSFRLPQGVVPLIISRHNFELLLNEGRTLEEYFNAAGDKRLDQIHTATLPADTYPSAKEMYARPAVDSAGTTPTVPESAPVEEPAEPELTAPSAPAPVLSPVNPAPTQPSESETPATPESTSRPAQPAVRPVPTPEPANQPEPDEFDYDIPVPVVPVGKPPVAPRVD